MNKLAKISQVSGGIVQIGRIEGIATRLKYYNDDEIRHIAKQLTEIADMLLCTLKQLGELGEVENENN